MLLIIAGVLLASGCDSQKPDHKELALQRWQSARGQMTTQMAREQLQRGELKHAEDSIRSVLSHGEYAPAQVVLGQIRLEQGQLRAAEIAFQQAQQLQPDNAEATYGLGVVSERRGRREEALGHYEKASNINPANPEYLLAMVDTKVGLGQEKAALEQLLEMLDGAEPSAALYMTAGRLLARQGDLERAVEMYKQARMLAPESTMVRETLALALLQTNQPAQALALFQELLQQANLENPETAESLWFYELGQGDCYAAMGEYHKAQRCYETVCGMRPDDDRPWVRRARAALQADRLEQAQAYARRALTLDPDSDEAKMVLGYVALATGDNVVAEQQFRELADRTPEHAMAHCLLGQALEAQGQRQAARQCYVQALSLDPEDRLAQQLLEGVQETQVGTVAPVGAF
jgi:tetratricopeptide (TPR) repeat protein